MIHSLCRQIQVLNMQRLFPGCSDFEISLVAELAGSRHSNWFQTEGSATSLALCIARLGPEIIANDSLFTSHSCDRMISSVYLSLGNDASTGWVPWPMLLVFSRFWSRTQHGDPKNVTIQTFFAWSFSLSSGQENFFSRAILYTASLCLLDFLVISFISNQVDSVLIYEFQVEMTFLNCTVHWKGTPRFVTTQIWVTKLQALAPWPYLLALLPWRSMLLDT